LTRTVHRTYFIILQASIKNSTGSKYKSIDIKLASLKNSTWNTQTVPLPPPIYDNSKLVLDSKGYSHFICTQDHYRSLEDVNLIYTILYVSWNGSAWKTQIVASNLPEQDYGASPSGDLCLDANNNPHIASLIAGASRITYTSWTGKTWNTKSTDLSSGSDGLNLVLDAKGNPHISFGESSPIRYISHVMYATATETTQTTTPTSSTATSSSTVQPSAIWAVAATLLIIAAVAVDAYAGKKITSPKNKT
jgi:hypothetical protein